MNVRSRASGPHAQTAHDDDAGDARLVSPLLVSGRPNGVAPRPNAHGALCTCTESVLVSGHANGVHVVALVHRVPVNLSTEI